MLSTLRLTLMDLATLALPFWAVAGITATLLLLVAGLLDGLVEQRLMLGGYLLALLALVMALPLIPAGPLPWTLALMWASWASYRVHKTLATNEPRALFRTPLLS